MKLVIHILSLLITLCVSTIGWAQTDDEIKERADKLFEKEQYVEATKDFLHLLSLEPMSHELNFKYGACLLFNSQQKNQALRYLNYAVLENNVDSRAYYFRGKAFHLNFQFEEAKQNYQAYQTKRPKPDERYKVEREIEMCDNGKRLLTTFTDIIVADKKEIDQSKFFRIYSDSKTIGGEILVTERFQSKLDKKLGHVPIVHFPPNAKAIYYSSYGTDLSTGKDIFIRRRLPNGAWGDPQLLPGGVNTDQDEDFPYMHPSGNFLYFSSTGHNSMGGYDIFMSRFDPNINGFKSPENVDFAISSPDDDLFYVVDSLFQNAYFASARQSADGNLHVYKVKVARVPIQEVIIMGDFLSEINPENKKMNVTLTSHSNGKEVGTIKTNPSGKFSFVFPQGGKYDYVIEVDGSDAQYKFTVELPFLDEFKPLKQRIVHLTEDGAEIVKVINLFDEKVEGAEAILADIIRKKSELDVNIDKFDLEALELESKKKDILALAGFDNMSLVEVKDQLVEIQQTNEDNKAVSERIDANIDSEILAKIDRVKALDGMEKELLDKANNTADPVAKHKLLNEAKRKSDEKQDLITSIEALTELKETATRNIGIPADKVNALSAVVNEFTSAVEGGDETKALKLLSENTSLLAAAKEGSPDGVVDSYIQETKKIRNDIKKQKDIVSDYDGQVERLNREIYELESKLQDARKKEEEKILSQIDDKKTELAMVEEARDEARAKIKTLNRKANDLDTQIASLQNAIATEVASVVDQNEVETSIEEVEKIAESDQGINYDEEIASIEKQNPELFGLAPADPVADINSSKVEEEEAILADNSLSELEQTYRLQENNEVAIDESKSELATINEAINNDPGNEELQSQKETVEQYIGELEAENADYAAKAEELKAATPDVALSKEDIIKEVSPEYEDDISSLQNNSELTEEEQLNQIAERQEKFITELEAEIEKVNTAISEDPENSELQAKQEILVDIKSETEENLAITQQRLASVSVDVVEAKTYTPSDIVPGFEEGLAEIEANNSLEPKAKEEQLKEQEEELIAAIEKQTKKVDKQLKKNPEDQELIAEKKGLEELKDITQASIDERTQTLAALEAREADPANNSDLSEEELLAQMDPSYEENKKDFAKEAKKSRAGVVRLLELETEMYNRLSDRKVELETELAGNPDDEQIAAELALVNEMLTSQLAEVESTQNTLVDQMTEDERAEYIAEVDEGYTGEIRSINETGTSEDVVDREVELQMAIANRISELEEAQQRKFSVTVELDIKRNKRLLSESQTRESEARSVSPDVNTTNSSEEFIAELRENAEGASELTQEYETIEDLENQESDLASYEAELDDRITQKEKEIKKDSTPEAEEELEWLLEEKERVAVKRRMVRIQIGELETNVAENRVVSEGDDVKLNELRSEQTSLEERLNDDSLTSREKKAIENELGENKTAQTERENEIVESNIDQQEQETSTLSTSLASFDESSPEGRTSDKAQARIDKEEQTIAALEEEAAEAKTEDERNYILKEIEERREALNNDTKEVIEEMKIAELERELDVTLMTPEELKKKKRTFTIRIGELSTAIVNKDKEIAEAKKKDIPGLEVEKAQLVEERTLLIDRLARVDEQLTGVDESQPVVDPLAMKEEITFNEERQLAGTEEYEEYEKLASDALEVETQIRTLEDELKLEKRAVAQLIAEEENDENQEEIRARVERIKTIESDIDRLNVELIQKKYTAEQALPSNPDDAMRMQNLVARGIKPIKTTVVAAAILQLPATGFAVDTNAESVYSEANPIPVGVENPTGLVYRVQVGAFARPIPQNLFKEFNPVSGEKIEGTNITRYMAGFFNSSSDVVNARTQIRELGYSDAFVVAYCDGERIGFGDARRREAAGTCVPKGTSELMVEIAEKTAEKLGIPKVREVQEVPEYTYNQAPGAVEAEPIEMMQGLFFTVQIGVFNRPVGDESLNGMTEILTIRLPNGLIRYASGRFDSVADALPRRNLALNNGVKGAFVTAYYKGERIPLGEAKKLLAENGPSILQSSIEKEAPIEPEIEPEVIPDVVRQDTVSTDPVTPIYSEVNQLRVQVVTKKSFEEYPRDVLNRYNAEGSFYYDEEDKRVKSVIYKNEDYLPRLYNFLDDVDTVYIPVGLMADEVGKIVEVVFTDSIVPGDFMDMLLRMNYRREFETTERGAELRLFGVQEEKMNTVLNAIREFGVEPVIREETELELELEENK